MKMKNEYRSQGTGTEFLLFLITGVGTLLGGIYELDKITNTYGSKPPQEITRSTNDISLKLD